MSVTRYIYIKAIPAFNTGSKFDMLKRAARNEKVATQKGSLVWTSDGKPIDNDSLVELLVKDQLDLMRLLLI